MSRPLPRPQQRANLRKWYEEELRKKYPEMTREKRRAIAKQATKMFMRGELGPPREVSSNTALLQRSPHVQNVATLNPGGILCVHNFSIRACPVCSPGTR